MRQLDGVEKLDRLKGLKGYLANLRNLETFETVVLNEVIKTFAKGLKDQANIANVAKTLL